MTRSFIKNYSESNNIAEPEISYYALELLMNYNWPGNVRELKNTIESAVALNRNGVLDASIFINLLKPDSEKNPSLRNLPIYLKKSPEEADRELLYRALFELKKDICS